MRVYLIINSKKITFNFNKIKCTNNNKYNNYYNTIIFNIYVLITRVFNLIFIIISHNSFNKNLSNINSADILLNFIIINKYTILIFFGFLLNVNSHLTIILISLNYYNCDSFSSIIISALAISSIGPNAA